MNKPSCLGSVLAWLTRLQQPWNQNKHGAWINWNCYKGWGIYQFDSQIKQCEEWSNWTAGWLVHQKNTQLILTARFNIQATYTLSQKQYPGCTGNPYTTTDLFSRHSELQQHWKSNVTAGSYIFSHHRIPTITWLGFVCLTSSRNLRLTASLSHIVTLCVLHSQILKRKVSEEAGSKIISQSCDGLLYDCAWLDSHCSRSEVISPFQSCDILLNNCVA